MSVSQRALAAGGEIAAVTRFLARVGARASAPDVADLTFGNPHEAPLPALVDALRSHAEPQTPDWFAYRTNEEPGREVIAAGLRAEMGLRFDAGDVALTRGAFGAIELALHLIADVGDEVIIPVPGWFCYPPMLRVSGLVPVAVPLGAEDHDLDVDAIAAAITERTRIVVVNSPANPTGRVYGRDALESLAAALDERSAAFERRIWILSDEPYRRLRFDGIGFTSPAAVYPWTLIDYSFGKVLLAPGQRLGYLALSPLLPDPDRADLRGALENTQLALGWNFPDAVMQYAMADLEPLTIDVAALQSRRDTLHAALTRAGYRTRLSEGTFYVWAEAIDGDGDGLCDRLAAQGVLLMPGRLFDRPAWFRACLTANTEDVARAAAALVDDASRLR